MIVNAVSHLQQSGCSPSFVDICVAVQDDEALYLCCSEETADGDPGLPTEGGQPADEVRQYLLL